MKVIFNPLSGSFDYIVSSLADLSGVASGTATVFANTTTRVVNHDLDDIPIVILQSKGAGGFMNFVTDITTTQFTINLAAPQETDIDFDWEAKII